MVVVQDKGLDMFEELLFSLYSSIGSIMNLLFRSWGVYITGYFMQNSDNHLIYYLAPLVL